MPAEAYVLHRCDTPRCINPDHLILGTQAENMQQANNSGRKSHLDAEAANKIKGDKRPGAVIAAEYGITRDHVYKIRNGVRWASTET